MKRVSKYRLVTVTAAVRMADYPDGEEHERQRTVVACKAVAMAVLKVAFQRELLIDRPYTGIDYPLASFNLTTEESDNLPPV